MASTQPPQQHDDLGVLKTSAPSNSSWFGTFTAALNVIGTVLIVAMAIAVNADVFGRNAFNHPIFSNPNTDPTNADFGKVTSQANLPRDIQLAAKIVF